MTKKTLRKPGADAPGEREARERSRERAQDFYFSLMFRRNQRELPMMLRQQAC